MKVKLLTLLVSLVMPLLVSISVQAADTGPVSEIFACNFKDGKDMSDNEASIAFFLEQREKIGSRDLDSMQTTMWWPQISNSGIDTIWMDTFPNLSAFGRAKDAFKESEQFAALQATYEKVDTCTSSLHQRRQIYDGGELAVTAPATLQTFRCTFNPGKTMADVEVALNQWSSVLDDLGTYKGTVAYMFTPLITASPFDVSYYMVHDNYADYAATNSSYLSSDAGQQMDARWQEIHRCETGLWNGRIMVQPVTD